jgi:hypothetical protein
MIFQLGMGDWSEFMDKIQEVVPMDQQPELLQKLSELYLKDYAIAIPESTKNGSHWPGSLLTILFCWIFVREYREFLFISELPCDCDSKCASVWTVE